MLRAKIRTATLLLLPFQTQLHLWGMMGSQQPLPFCANPLIIPNTPSTSSCIHALRDGPSTSIQCFSSFSTTQDTNSIPIESTCSTHQINLTTTSTSTINSRPPIESAYSPPTTTIALITSNLFLNPLDSILLAPSQIDSSTNEATNSSLSNLDVSTADRFNLAVAVISSIDTSVAEHNDRGANADFGDRASGVNDNAVTLQNSESNLLSSLPRAAFEFYPVDHDLNVFEFGGSIFDDLSMQSIFQSALTLPTPPALPSPLHTPILNMQTCKRIRIDSDTAAASSTSFNGLTLAHLQQSQCDAGLLPRLLLQPNPAQPGIMMSNPLPFPTQFERADLNTTISSSTRLSVAPSLTSSSRFPTRTAAYSIIDSDDGRDEIEHSSQHSHSGSADEDSDPTINMIDTIIDSNNTHLPLIRGHSISISTATRSTSRRIEICSLTKTQRKTRQFFSSASCS